MEKYRIQNDLKAFGLQVHTFPNQIGDAFALLAKTINDGFNRGYYGISYFSSSGKIIYKAAAEEKFAGEPKKYNLEEYIIERGDYLMAPVKDWRKKMDCIKDVFNEIMQDKRCDETKPCVEWYKDDNEMLCMIKMDDRRAVSNELENIDNELTKILSALSEESINIIPFENSWTIAQVAGHIMLSNQSVLSSLTSVGKVTDKNPYEGMEKIKGQFLDFSKKLKSPEFILPTKNIYKKETIINDLKSSTDKIKDLSNSTNLNETVTHRVFGEVTKLELLYFVVYHTQRHLQQLQNILKIVTDKIQ